MTAVLNVLLEITVYSAVLYAAILLFQKVFHRHISAAFNYVVWALLILRLLIPVTVDSGIHLFVLPEEPKQVLQAEPSGSSSQQQPDHNVPAEQAAIGVSSDTQTIDKISSPLSNSIQNQPEPWIIDWQTALVLLWGTGAACSFAFVAIHWRRLQKKISRHGIAAPGYVLKLTYKCKRDMGVKADLHVSMQSWLRSPALFASLTPHLLLPLHMSDIRQLEFGIRHELTHYRRRDHLVNILLMVLRCVYWFNPIVYLAFRRMQTDMETACDASVTSRLNGCERISYIQTMIDIGGSAVEYVLGMGMCRGRKAMEKRVRGMFMKQRTKPPVRMAAALLAVLMLITCFTTACQPTPEEAIIVNKNDGKLEEMLGQNPMPPESYKASDHWSETAENDKLKIVIDTDVFVPDVNKYPVVKLERTVFTQQRVDELVNYFAKGKQLHLPHVMTKADYEQWIVAAKRGELIDGEYVVTPETLSWIKELEAKQAAAPEDSPVIYTDTTLTYERYPETGEDIIMGGRNFLSVAFDNEKGGDAYISIDNYTPGYNSFTSFSYSAEKYTSSVTESLYQDIIDSGESEAEWGYPGAGALFDKVEVTRDEAIAEANKVLSGLGINHVMLVGAEKYVTPDAPEKSGYMLEYARESGGIPLCWHDGGSWFGGEEPAAYTPPFTEEVLTAHVSKSGLVSMHWRGCADVIEAVNENVEMLPFETIQQMIKDQIFYKKSAMRVDMDRDITVTVTSAELRAGYIGVKNNLKQALMVPVWVFETRISYYDAVSGAPYDYKDNTYMLSAIDGGVIEYPREPAEYIDVEGRKPQFIN